MQKHCLESVDRIFKDIFQNTLTFGGKTVDLSRDFSPMFSVIPTGSKHRIIRACFKISKLYNCFATITISEDMRLKALHEDRNANEEAIQYTYLLLKVGEGSVLGTEDEEDLIMLLPSVKQVRQL